MTIRFDYDYIDPIIQPTRGIQKAKVRRLFVEALNVAAAREDGQVNVYDDDLEDDAHGSSLACIFTNPATPTRPRALVVEYQERSPLAVELAKMAEETRGAVLVTLDEAVA